MSATRWAKYPTAEHEVTAANFRAAFGRHARSLVRNHMFRGWIGAVPIFWGKAQTGGTLAKDTTASDYRAGAAAKWTQGSGDPENELLQDVGGIIGPPWTGDEEDWPGVQVVARVKTSAASFVRAYAKVGAVEYTSSYHTGGGGWEDLVVEIPADALSAIDDTVYVGVQFATVGSNTDAYVDEVLAVPGGFTPEGLILPDSRVFPEVGVLDSTNTRRFESDLVLLVFVTDGTIESGGAGVDFSPDLATLLGDADPGIVAAMFNPHTSGTNAWTTSQISKISTVDVKSGGIQVHAFNTTSFGTAGNNLRATLLLWIEPKPAAVLP